MPEAEAKAKNLPFVRKMESRIEKLAERIRDYKAKTEKFEVVDLSAALDAADKELRIAVGILTELPDDIGYARTKTSAIEVGTIIEIRENRRDLYEGVFSDADMIGLEVEKVAKTRIIAKTTSGSRVVLQRGHVSITKD